MMCFFISHSLAYKSKLIFCAKLPKPVILSLNTYKNLIKKI